MFIGKFNQVSSSKFTPNKYGQMPYIATVLAGTATGSIIDTVVFENGNNVPGELYLCENGTREYEGVSYPTTVIVAKVSALEYMQLRKELGAGRTVLTESSVPTGSPTL